MDDDDVLVRISRRRAVQHIGTHASHGCPAMFLALVLKLRAKFNTCWPVVREPCRLCLVQESADLFLSCNCRVSNLVSTGFGVFCFPSVPCSLAVAMVFHVGTNWTHSFLLRKLECFKHVP